MIRLKKPFMEGSAVRRVQEMLSLIGFSAGEPDGKYGPCTEDAICAFQMRYGLEEDGIVGPLTLRALRGAATDTKAKDRGRLQPKGLVDISYSHVPPRNMFKTRPKRDLSKIDSIVLHQTGCGMPNTPGGWGRVNAHYGIMQDGTPIQLNPLTMSIWHAQGLSLRGIGIEIEGNYRGDEGSEWSLWAGGGPAANLNDKMTRAAQVILDDIWSHDVTPSHVYAHRQSSRMRRACPGGEIWRRIGIPLRGILDCPDEDLLETFGKDSRTIPTSWDKNGFGGY